MMPGTMNSSDHRKMKMYCTMDSRMIFPAKENPSNSAV